MSVAVLVVPTGGVTVAEFVNVPVAVELTVPVTVYVIALLAGRSTPVWSILPEPLVAKPVAVALPVLAAVQVTLVRPEGHRIGDRGPGFAARARVADDDRVGQRLTGSDVAGRWRDARPAGVVDLGNRQVGQVVVVGRGS